MKSMKEEIDKACFERLFSKVRVDSYTDINQYSANIRLIKDITPKLCLFEVFVRNKILSNPIITDRNLFVLQELKKQKGLDFLHPNPLVDIQNCIEKIQILRERLKSFVNTHSLSNDENDLFETIDGMLNNAQKTREFQDSEIDKIISLQSLGFWATIINNHKKLTFLSDRNFLQNTSNFLNFSHPDKINQRDIIQSLESDNIVDWIVIFLIKNLRNRAFHWENLLKVTSKGYSRISISRNIPNRSKKLIISIKIEYIKNFLDLCLEACDDSLIMINKAIED